MLARARAPGSGGFVVLPGVFADPAEVAIGTGDHVPAAETVLVIHTSKRLLRKHGRPVIGHQDLSARDEELQLNTRGNGLYPGRGVRSSPRRGRARAREVLPVLAAGSGAVDYFLQEIVSRQAGEPVGK